jgi:drug/metabolite transporter (DMT)-like permease
VPAGWLISSSRVVGVVLITLPLLIRGRGRLALPRAALPWLVATAVAEVVGYWTYLMGARVSISVTAVLASQFAAIAAVGAYVLFGERLSRVQRSGVGLICIGVAALAILRSAA